MFYIYSISTYKGFFLRNIDYDEIPLGRLDAVKRTWLIAPKVSASYKALKLNIKQTFQRLISFQNFYKILRETREIHTTI